MRMTAGFLLLTALTSSFVTGAAAQQPAGEARDESLTITATEVQLDAVVRDGRGRAVRDLTAADFEVAEDGTPQQVLSVRYESRARPATDRKSDASSSSSVAPGASAEDIRAVAIVFDRLDASGRALARKAAARYVSDYVQPADFVGVFVTDLGLQIVQPFTVDKKAVARAVDAASGQGTASFHSQAEEARNLKTDQPATAPSSTPSYSADEKGQAVRFEDPNDKGGVDRQIRLAQARTLEAFERLQREEEGEATLNGLRAVVRGLSALPGRKAVLFFSTGVALPPKLLQRYQAVIDAANRGGVSIYAVNAAGLQVAGASTGGGMTSEPAVTTMGIVMPQIQAMERMEDAMRSDPNSSLGVLAKQTGGAYIRDTNDASKFLPQIDEDLDAHYVVAYAPKNTNFDGRFRSVALRVKRDNLTVRSREGYFAVPSIGGAEVRPFEARGVSLLQSGRQENAFRLNASALDFGGGAGKAHVAFVAAVPATSLALINNSETKTYRTDFTIVTLFRNKNGDVVSKQSQHYEYEGPLAEPPAWRHGSLYFYRDADVPPGEYTLEVAAVDVASSRASTYRAAVEVPAVDTPLAMSSVLVLNRTERLAPGAPDAAPLLRHGDLVLVPNLGEPISKAKLQQLAFYVTVYGQKLEGEHGLVIELLSGGKQIAKLPTELPAPDAQGRIDVANALPLGELAPGDYELKITAFSGANRVSRSTPFRLVP